MRTFIQLIGGVVFFVFDTFLRTIVRLIFFTNTLERYSWIKLVNVYVINIAIRPTVYFHLNDVIFKKTITKSIIFCL